MKKKLFIKAISLFLVVASLLPFVISCKDNGDPNTPTPPGDKGGGNPEPTVETIGVKQISSVEKVLMNPESATFTSKNLSVDHTLGVPTLKWNVVSGTTTVSTETVQNFVDYYYLEFSIYCPQPTNTTIKIQPIGARHGQPVVLDFSGWMKFRIRTEEYQAYYPCPDIKGIYLTIESGTGDNTAIYISEMKLTRPVYELVVPEGIDINDASIYDKIVANFRNKMVGDQCVLDTPEYMTKVGSIEGGKNTQWASFKATYMDNAGPGVVFGVPMDGVDPTGIDKDPVTGKVKKLGTNIKLYYQNLRDMAEGYACVKGAHYKNPELLADIKKGLEYGYKYYYGEEILQGINYGDWFPWQISIPGEIVMILSCIQPDIEQELIDKYLAPFASLITHPRGAASNMINSAFYIIVGAALRKDAYMIAEALELIQNEYQYVDYLVLDAREIRDGGFYSDGSFVQHTGIPYTYSYGQGMFSSLANIGFITVGTAFERQNEVTEHQYELLFNAFLPTLYDINGTNALKGRSLDIHTMERESYKSIFATAVLIRTYAPERWKAKYDAAIKYMINEMEAKFHENWVNSVPIYALDALALATDESVTAFEGYEKTFVFGNMDRVFQHTPKYGVALSLSSTRIYKYESINAENELGWYHGDGMLYLYTDGYDYGFHHTGYVNPYLMTGTTVNLAPRIETCFSPAYYNTSPYAGGVSQGKYGAAGFILGYPSDAPAFEVPKAKNISAKKSYFFFDNEIVCLGSDIYDESGYNVVTTVDNRLWSLNWRAESPGYYFDKGALYVGGEQVTPTIQSNPKSDVCAVPNISNMTSIDERTMWFGNMGGYVFLGNEDVYYRVVANHSNAKGTEAASTGTMDFLEVVINHGKGDGNLENDKYAYVYLPEATVEETESYNENPDIVMLKRNSKTHAVIDTTIRTLGAVIFSSTGDTVSINNESTPVTSIKASTACTLMISTNEAGETIISIADATQNYRKMEFEIQVKDVTEVISADSAISASVTNGTVKITLNCADNLGQSFNLTVK